MTVSETAEYPPTSLRSVRAKLIFNPAAGDIEVSPFQLAEIITQLQALRIVPEVYMVTPDSRLPAVVSSALKRGIKLIIVSGGDGTIESAAGPMVGTDATLGIIPTGTRNNLALSLSIPNGIPEAIALLRQGQRIKMDVGRAQCGRTTRWFLETSSIGLVSALYPAADDIQHGNLGRIADFLSTLVSAQAGEMRMLLNDQEKVVAQGHLAFVANTAYFGANYQLSADVSFRDSLLDLFVFSELNKLELVSYAVQISAGAVEDARILHYRVKSVVIETTPRMPAMADGFTLGEGPLAVSIRPGGLNVVAGQPAGSVGAPGDEPVLP